MKEKAFGTQFKIAMEKRGIKQKDLADTIGVSKKALSDYARGKSQPTASVIAAIARELNVSADFLLGLKHEFTPLRTEDPLAEEIQIIRDSYGSMSYNERQAIMKLIQTFGKGES